jgi:hypothetical protein
MKMNIYTATALIISGLFLFACQGRTNTSFKKEYVGEEIATPIVYEVIVKNPDPDDTWKEECLKNTHLDRFVQDILKAVKSEKLVAYHYYTGEKLSVKEVEKIVEDSNMEDHLGNIQFEEEWIWDNSTLSLQKKVNKIMFGYEVYNSDGSLRGYKASFVVDLNK